MNINCRRRNCRLLFQFILCLPFSVVHATDLIIETTSGKVRGATKTGPTGKLVDVWQSIPFAMPPVGPLRFQHPQPPKEWDGVLDTDQPPNSCWQALYPEGDFDFDKWNPNTPLSEDCLYLTVTVPRPRPREGAVMVWIYGGGFISGTSTLDAYDTKTLASEENVIVVAIQYRVASLGFLYLDNVGAAGNAGLYDQVMALQWIQKNIRAFGGNPDCITLFGESAGSASVSMHVLSPISRDLFSRAILQSGAATNPWTTVSKEEGIKRGLDLAKRVDCPHNPDEVDTIIECLRGRNASSLIHQETIMESFLEFTYIPIVDGHFLDKNPARTLSDKSGLKKLDLLLGSNSEEGFMFVYPFLKKNFFDNENVTITRDQYLEVVASVNPNANKLARHAIDFEYTNWLNPKDSASNIDMLDKMVGDYQFVCGINEFAQRFEEAGNNVFMYLFTQRASISPIPQWMGVLHGEEISFVFGEPLNPKKGYREDEKTFSQKVMRYWANFAKTGNPNKNEDYLYTEDYWPLYDSINRDYVVLEAGKNTTGQSHRARQCAFWNQHLPQLQKLDSEFNAEVERLRTALQLSDRRAQQCSAFQELEVEKEENPRKDLQKS